MAKRTLFRTLIVRLRMFWADIRGHHGKRWDYEPGDYYMGNHKGHNKHMKKQFDDYERCICIMLDRFCYNFFSKMDDICEWIADRFNKKKKK